MQRLSRDIESIQAYCDLKLTDDGKIVFSERPGTTWKQQWEIDRFRAVVASDARAQEALRRCIREAIETPRETDENPEQQLATSEPAPASPSRMRSTQPASSPPVSLQAPQIICDDEPTPQEIDIADAMLSFIAEQSGPVSEAAVLEAAGGDEVLNRNVLHRLAIDRIVEPLKGGMYRIPDWPPKNAGLPDHCPTRKGGQAIGNCVLAAPLLAKLVKEKVVSPSVGCPLRRVCGPTR